MQRIFVFLLCLHIGAAFDAHKNRKEQPTPKNYLGLTISWNRLSLCWSDQMITLLFLFTPALHGLIHLCPLPKA